MFLIVGFLVSTLILVYGKNDCPNNQIYSQCVNPCGPEKCFNNGATCAGECVPGCACPPGKLLNPNGVCVSEKQCCSGNLVFSRCASPCGPIQCNPRLDISCAAVCVNGCVCPSGMKLNDAGSCVSKC